MEDLVGGDWAGEITETDMLVRQQGLDLAGAFLVMVGNGSDTSSAPLRPRQGLVVTVGGYWKGFFAGSVMNDLSGRNLDYQLVAARESAYNGGE